MLDKYRRRPGPAVEAMRFVDGKAGEDIVYWVRSFGVGAGAIMDGEPLLAWHDPAGIDGVDIYHRGARRVVGRGDWVVCDRGGFSVCSAADFTRDYERVDDDSEYLSAERARLLDEIVWTQLIGFENVPDYTPGVVTAEGVFDA